MIKYLKDNDMYIKHLFINECHKIMKHILVNSWSHLKMSGTEMGGQKKKDFTEDVRTKLLTKQ